MDHLSRRDFLKLGALASAGLATSFWLDASLKYADAQALSMPDAHPLAVPAAARTRVSVTRSPQMTSGDKLNPEVVGRMLDAGICFLYSVTDSLDGWSRVAGPDDVVAMKVNCQSSARMYTDPVVTYAVADRLIEVGVRPENITIYDRDDGFLRRGFYTLNRGGPGVQCYGNMGDYVGPYSYGIFNGRICRLVAEEATVLINLPLVKQHKGAGVTCSMKNHFGTIEFPADNHRNHGNPQLAHINMLDVIRSKQRLIICDGSFGCYDGGPRCDLENQWRHNRIMMGTDPVAIDTLAWQVIEAVRVRYGLASLGSLGLTPVYLATAAALGLGTNNIARMRVQQTLI